MNPRALLYDKVVCVTDKPHPLDFLQSHLFGLFFASFSLDFISSLKLNAQALEFFFIRKLKLVLRYLALIIKLIKIKIKMNIIL